MPTVGFANMSLDLGQFVEKFVKKMLGPVVPLIDKLSDVTKFMSGSVPVITDILADVPAEGIALLHTAGYFTTYDGVHPYTWLNLGVDSAIRAGEFSESEGQKIYSGLKIVFESINLLENLLHSSGGQGQIALGDFYFGGHAENGLIVGEKDLRLARVLINAVDELSSLGSALPDLSRIASTGSSAVGNYIGSLFGGKLTGYIDQINSALQSVGDLGQQILGAARCGRSAVSWRPSTSSR